MRIYGALAPVECQPEKVHKILREKFNTDIVSKIGEGSSGVAYELSNGDVLKITTNQQEGRVANWLVSNPNPNIANYKTIWPEGDLYYIIMEKIEPLASSSPLREQIEKILAMMESSEARIYVSTEINNIIEFLEKQQTRRNLPLVGNVFLDYLKHISELSQQIPIFDFLNIDNIGIKDGKLKFFDIT